MGLVKVDEEHYAVASELLRAVILLEHAILDLYDATGELKEAVINRQGPTPKIPNFGTASAHVVEHATSVHHLYLASIDRGLPEIAAQQILAGNPLGRIETVE